MRAGFSIGKHMKTERRSIFSETGSLEMLR